MGMDKIVPEPDPAHTRATHAQALEAQRVRDARGAPSGVLQAQSQYLLLNLWSQAGRMQTFRTAFLLPESGDAADLKGSARLVETCRGGSP